MVASASLLECRIMSLNSLRNAVKILPGQAQPLYAWRSTTSPRIRFGNSFNLMGGRLRAHPGAIPGAIPHSPRCSCEPAAYTGSEGLSPSILLTYFDSPQDDKGKNDEILYRRTVYDHEDWKRHRSSTRHSRHMLAIASSRVVVALVPPVFTLTLLAAGVAIFNEAVLAGLFSPWIPLLHVSSLPFQLIAPAVALLLVFRTNSSYGRFDEARKAWGSNVNRARDLVRQAVTLLRHPADTTKLSQLLRYIVVFSFCLKDHLSREDELRNELKGVLDEVETEAVMASSHKPNFVLQAMTEIIHDSHLKDMEKALMDSNLTQLHDNVGGCERIFKTPIPLPYTRLTSRILVIWHMLLPLALWDKCHWVIIPATFLSAAALFCIEEVGVLIEEPFSILPLNSMCKTIQKNVEELLQAHKDLERIKEKNKE